LAETTVSRKVLQESEKRLIDTNFDLQHEIADRKLAEKALAAEKEQLAVTLRSIGEGVITADTSGKIVLLNQAAEHLTGWAQAEAVGLPFADIFNSVDEKTKMKPERPLPAVLENEPENPDRAAILVNRYGAERIITLNGAPTR
jgi:two-component system cell cycle sensor histidine kinase/response regulator CckA